MNNTTYLEALWDKRALRQRKKLNTIKILIYIGISFMLLSLFLPVDQATPYMKSLIKSSEYFSVNGHNVNSNIFEEISPIGTIKIYNELSFDNTVATYKWLLIAEIILFVLMFITIIVLSLKKPSGILIILAFVAMIQYAFIWGISGVDTFKIFPENYFTSGISAYFGFGGAVITLVSCTMIPGCVSTNR